MALISTRTLQRRWKTRVRRWVFGSHAQYGEDLHVDAMLGVPRPFYVDVGANHPVHLSNTWRFYRRGAHGINIEPDPSVFPRLTARRPRDVNLQIGIGSARGSLPFYRMSASTLSTFSRSDAELYLKDGYRIVDTVQVPVRPLADVLAEHRPEGPIDLCSIDVEGRELDILSSNDWKRFRPTVIVLEINRDETGLLSAMDDLDYVLVINNGTNGLFLDGQARSTRRLAASVS